MKKYLLLGVLGLLPGASVGAELYLANVSGYLSNTRPDAGTVHYYKCSGTGSGTNVTGCRTDAIKITYTSISGGSGTSSSPYILTGCSYVGCACHYQYYLSESTNCVRCPNNSQALETNQYSNYHRNTTCPYCPNYTFKQTTSGGINCVDCPENATCDGVTFLCDKNYYQPSALVCNPCPQSGLTDEAGATTITKCYLRPGTAFSDTSGSGVYSDKCFYIDM